MGVVTGIASRYPMIVPARDDAGVAQAARARGARSAFVAVPLPLAGGSQRDDVSGRQSGGSGTTRILQLMALTVLIDMAGFALALPMLPFWAQRFGADAFAIGMMMAAYSVAQLIFTPIVGTLSDRFGRRRAIVGALILEAIGFVGTALAGSVAALVVARFVGGIGGSSIGSAQAVVADVTGPNERARGMGFIGAAIGVGFVIGPAAGALLSVFGPAVPFWGAAVVVLLDIGLVIVSLPETRAAAARARAGLNAFAPLRLPAVGRLVAVTLLFTTAFAGMETVLPLFTQSALAWGAAENGLAFAAVGLTMVIIQGGLIGRIVKRFGERRLLLVGLLLVAGGLAVLPLGAVLATIVAGAGLTTLGMALIYPTSTSLLSYVAAPDQAGATLGVARSAGGLARVIGPALAGVSYTRLGSAAPFLLSAAITLAAVVLVPVDPLAGEGATASVAAGPDQQAELRADEQNRS
jgi:DHA1 family tetracycline resistance protein-like MFS transporter